MRAGGVAGAKYSSKNLCGILDREKLGFAFFFRENILG